MTEVQNSHTNDILLNDIPNNIPNGIQSRTIIITYGILTA
jgi:hypothetical protein